MYWQLKNKLNNIFYLIFLTTTHINTISHNMKNEKKLKFNCYNDFATIKFKEIQNSHVTDMPYMVEIS